MIWISFFWKSFSFATSFFSVAQEASSTHRAHLLQQILGDDDGGDAADDAEAA